MLFRRRRLHSLDIFGVPITLNYKGDSEHRTVIGAMFTAVLGCLILVVSLLGVSDVLMYKDP